MWHIGRARHSEEEEDLELQIGELWFEALDETVATEQFVSLKGSEKLEQAASGGRLAIASLWVQRE